MASNVELLAVGAAAAPLISHPLKARAIKLHSSLCSRAFISNAMVVQHRRDESDDGSASPRRRNYVGYETQPCDDQESGSDGEPRAAQACMEPIELRLARLALTEAL